MTDFKKLFKQYWQFGLIAAIAIVVVTFVSATGGDSRQAGSSYSNAANGYSTWYRMMSERGMKMHRWQRSFPQLTKNSDYQSATTLLQVNPQLEKLQLTKLQRTWVSQGNTLVILGVAAPAWEMPFQTDLESFQGNVRIETTRRFRADSIKQELPQSTFKSSVLSDQSGSVIATFKLDKGLVIIASTSHLAANAYQDFQPNYELLATLVTQDRGQVLVDEYIHGYIDRQRKSATSQKTSSDEIADDRETDGDALAYLANTPLFIVSLNILLGILVLFWQQNRRFGKVIVPKLPEIDNSEAYIQALSGVLYQANSSEFVLQNIGRAEQLTWQQKLGLGKERLVEPQTLITAWETQTKLPTEDLRFVLQLTTVARRLTPAELTNWLAKVRTINRQLNRG
ncbi:DUF4350 domain-containing protein [Chamaesiphon sp. OTE_75_metabat_556]|uniref:DUF4350 domain-containing protein n=1 Tax=Chamaesiphon sp. OTE_75_metabat_556 TaxID=2964692 RepID=UPI00286A4D0D|nr:DUF4350 domain-containing protein [Chamaesiphon sp. OTE_75_metabat_556]